MPGLSPTTAFTRGACPSVQRPFVEADGLLVRVRVPGGIVSTDQARTLAVLADRCGSGTIEITSRANLQLRGVANCAHRRVIDGLVDVGLTHPDPDVEERRNVVASPTTGL